MLARGGENVGEIRSTSSTGIVGKTKITDIRRAVGDDVDKFIND
jgi:hypothetical protein